MRLKNFVKLEGAAVACVLTVLIVGALTHWDGQAAILALPLVLGAWILIPIATVMELMLIFNGKGVVTQKQIGGLALVFAINVTMVALVVLHR